MDSLLHDPKKLTLQASYSRILGVSWVVTSELISRVNIVITHILGLASLLITTHEPPSTGM